MESVVTWDDVRAISGIAEILVRNGNAQAGAVNAKAGINPAFATYYYFFFLAAFFLPAFFFAFFFAAIIVSLKVNLGIV